MDDKRNYSKEDLDQPIVKLAEELDRRAQKENLAKHTEGKQAGFGSTDCEDIVDAQRGDKG